MSQHVSDPAPLQPLGDSSAVGDTDSPSAKSPSSSAGSPAPLETNPSAESSAPMGASRARPWQQAVVLATLVVVVQALLVTLFAWPVLRLEPRDLPLVVAGPAPAASAFADQMGAEKPGFFKITTVADEDTADAALRDRTAYGAFIVGQDGVVLHVASAASPMVAQLLTQMVQTLGQGRPVAVVDVVPTDADDPRGLGFATGFLPLVLTSLLAGALIGLLVSGRVARFLGVGVFALLAGLVGTAILQAWLGALPGSYLANASVVALLALAMSGTVAGLTASFGAAGLGLGALTVFIVGNPLSGVTAAPELLPQPWGLVGQWLPPGAGGTLLRSVAYFDGAGAMTPALILAGWSAGGLVLLAFRRRTAGRLMVARAAIGRGALPAATRG